MLDRRHFLLTSFAAASLLPRQCLGQAPVPSGGERIVRDIDDLRRACAEGGLYRVMPGIYVLGDTVLRPVSGTRLIGSPGLTVLRKTTSPGPYRLRAFFDIENARDVLLEGLIFDHAAKRTEHGVIVRARTPGASSNLVVRNCEFRQCHMHIERFVEGVRVTDTRFLGAGVAMLGIATGGQISKVDGKGINADGAVRNVRLERLYFEKIRSEAIDINWHTRNLVARAITAIDCDLGGEDEAIDIGGDLDATEANNCRDIVFEDVMVRNSSARSSDTIGIHVKGGSRNVILRNVRISRPPAPGRTVGLRIWNALDTNVEGLVVDGCTYGVVSVGSGNRVPAGMALRKLAVRHYQEDAIELQGDRIVLDDFEVDESRAKGVGLELLNASRATVRNGRITTRGRVGIKVRPTTSASVLENVAVNGRHKGAGFELQTRGVRLAN